MSDSRAWMSRLARMSVPTRVQGSPDPWVRASTSSGAATCADTVGGAEVGMASLEVLLGAGASVVLLGFFAVRVSVRLGLPSLLLYLAIGILLGESVIGIQFSDAALTESLGLGALVLILAEGGLTTRWRAVRPALGVGIALSTVAVAVSIGVVGVALHLLLGLDWRAAFLWGAVLSSTDAAAVFSVLRGVGVRRRLAAALELESELNVSPVSLAVLLLASPEPLTWWTPALVMYELVVG